MKIVVPVADQKLNQFENGGHAPLFAILEKTGSETWSGIKLVEFRNNPKAKPDSPGRCNHSVDEDQEKQQKGDHRHEHEEKIDTHGMLADSVADCDLFIAQWACGKTRAALRKKGVSFHLMTEDLPEVRLIRDFLKRESGNIATI